MFLPQVFQTNKNVRGSSKVNEIFLAPNASGFVKAVMTRFSIRSPKVLFRAPRLGVLEALRGRLSWGRIWGVGKPSPRLFGISGNSRGCGYCGITSWISQKWAKSLISWCCLKAPNVKQRCSCQKSTTKTSHILRTFMASDENPPGN